MSPRRPWTNRILELLADGEWHPYDEIVDQAGPVIPPGFARRRAESNRARLQSRHGTPAPPQRAQPADTIAIGRRSITIGAIHSLERCRRIEIRDRHARLTEGSRR